MNHKSHEKHERGELLVYQSADGQIKLNVRLQDETVWLTQPLMAELFQTTRQNISQHIQNIYDEGELIRDATHKKFLSVRREGNRDVCRELDFYNLDMTHPFALSVFFSFSRRSRVSRFKKEVSA